MRTKSIFAEICLVFSLTAATLGQPAQVARVTFLKPKNQFGPELANAYKKHLEWHRQAADPWTWYAWQVISGEDIGTLVDLTVVQWGDLDHPVDPAADLADFNAKVGPEASAGRIELWSVAAGPPATFAQPRRLLVLGRLHVSDKEMTLPKSGALARSCDLLPRADGDADREIIVLCPAKSWEEVSNGLAEISLLAKKFHAGDSHSEVLRYRQDLLYAPSK